jgi:hypothetical protein
MTASESDTIALLGIALPLAAKVAVDLAVTSMPANIPHSHASSAWPDGKRQPLPGHCPACRRWIDPKSAETALIANARAAILSEMDTRVGMLTP